MNLSVKINAAGCSSSCEIVAITVFGIKHTGVNGIMTTEENICYQELQKVKENMNSAV